MAEGSESHSLRYVFTGVSEPSPGLPPFTTVGYVDGQPFFHYDSEERKVKSGVPWMEKVEQEDPHYWDRQAQAVQGDEFTFRRNLAVLRNRYNQSGEKPLGKIYEAAESASDGGSNSSFDRESNSSSDRLIPS